MKRVNPTFMIYLVSFAAFLGPFTQTIYAPILPEIQADFATSQFMVNLTISIFTVVLAVMQMVYGPLADQKGRRKVLLPGIGVYVLASVGCAFAGSIGQLFLFRGLQAAGIAAGSVVATTVIGDLFDGKMRGRAMGTFQMLVALGPVLGPVIGGFLGGKAGYHGIFLALAATGLVMWAANFLFLPETRPEVAATRGFRAQDFAYILFDPVGSAVVWLGFIQFYTWYNFLVFLPDLLTHEYALTAEEKGMVFLPLSLMLVVGSYLGGRLQERVEARKSLLTTALLNVLAVVLFLFVSKLSLWLLIASGILFGLFLGLSLPVQTLLLTGRFIRERATAIGVYNFFRYMGMAAGPLVGSLLYHLGEGPLLYGFAATAFGGVVWFAYWQLFGRGSATRQVRH